VIRIAQATTPAEIDRTRDLLREYTRWAMESFESNATTAPTFQNLERELANLPGAYAPPDGRLFLAELDGEPAGCIALRRHDGTSGEVKRLYVKPGLRGHRIGGRLVSALIDAAREIGYRRLVLDSHRSMTGAHALYQQAGFQVVETPAAFPEHLKPVVVFMEMTLD